MAKFTKIPETTFQKLQLNAGVLLKSFDPKTAETAEDAIIGATSGGVSFTATPSFTDFGEDIDNCPKNMKELKKLDSWEVTMSGSFVTVDAATAKLLIGLADVGNADTPAVTPRNDVLDTDFTDLWWVGDYSDDNSEENGGFIAIHMLNSLSTGGFSIQSGDKAKGTFAFTFTGHFSMAAQDKVPFEVYVKGAE